MNQTKPMVICDRNGHPIDVVRQSEKGFRKSIEQNEIWSIHAGTGRLLPYRHGTAAAIADRGSWYLARLDDVPGDDVPGDGSSARLVGDPKTDAGVAQSERGVSVETADAQIGEVLMELARLIRDRRREMPEGSYTTHLFSSGGEKIRKKIGEESVEVVLATDRASLIGEVADLLYHLLVLLENEGIALGDVAAELQSR